MNKTGRNDPCPCGSGKKYKRCCLGKRAKPSPAAAAYLNPEEIARRWKGEAGPVVDREGRRLKRVVDRFRVDAPSALDHLRETGRPDGESVLFFDEDQWVGEADLSRGEEVCLLSASEKQADHLRAKVRGIPGLSYVDRTVEKLPALEEAPTGSQGSRDFKQQFFSQWPDEPNQRLDGATPREAAVSSELRPRLVALLQSLEEKETRLPRGERFSFKGLRDRLGVPG